MPTETFTAEELELLLLFTNLQRSQWEKSCIAEMCSHLQTKLEVQSHEISCTLLDIAPPLVPVGPL
jgi:hypothetical protein